MGAETVGRHRGARVTGGIIGHPPRSTVIRTLWRIKGRTSAQGVGENARPDFQELLTGADVIVWCDSSDEGREETLERRVVQALREPASVSRFGGWSLGESTHLINDAWLITGSDLPVETQVFTLDDEGTVTLPVWVDHVGSRGTIYVTGRVAQLAHAPERTRIPQIPKE